MKKILILLIILAVLFSSGCEKVIKPTDKVGSGNGVIVASITQNAPTYTSQLHFDSSEAKYHSFFQSFGPYLMNPKGDFPEEENKNGRLLALEVPPGNYDITSWIAYPHASTVVSSFSNNEMELTFTVKPGQITYLGNFHFNTLLGKSIIGASVPASAQLKISSEINIDISLFKRKYPNLSQMPVNIALFPRRFKSDHK